MGNIDESPTVARLDRESEKEKEASRQMLMKNARRHGEVIIQASRRSQEYSRLSSSSDEIPTTQQLLTALAIAQ